MRKHAKHCWGEDIIKKADEAKDDLTLDSIRESLAEAKKTPDGSIVAFFDRKGKGKVKYMMRQHTYEESRSVVLEIIQAMVYLLMVHSVEYVRWCAENMRSFKIIEDPGFHRLMKTGRPHLRIPSSRTLARDTHVVYQIVKKRIAKKLQVSLLDHPIWLYTHHELGLWRTSKHCYGCMDLPQQSGICSFDSPFWGKQHSDRLSLGYGRSCCLPFGRNSCRRVFEYPEWLWHIRQGKHKFDII